MNTPLGTGILDTFEREDGTVGDNWLPFYPSGSFRVLGGMLAPPTPAAWAAIYWHEPLPGPHEVWATYDVAPNADNHYCYLQLHPHIDTPQDNYFLEMDSDMFQIGRTVDGTAVILDGTGHNEAFVEDGDTIGMSIVGDDVIGWRIRDGVYTEMLRATDTTYRPEKMYRLLEVSEEAPEVRISEVGGLSVPTQSHTSTRLYEALAPLAETDADQGYALAHYCNALALMLDQFADLSRDEDDRPGWVIALDPEVAPVDFLPWLGQFVGVRLTGSEAEGDARARIIAREGQSRGTLGALTKAVQDTLTGTKTVLVTERQGASAWAFAVATFAVETPDPVKTEDAARRVKAAGLLMTYNVIDDATFDVLRDTHTDFADVTATFADFDEVRENPSKQ